MADDDAAAHEQIRQELGQLRAELDRLRAEQRDARGRIILTMRGHARCPACGCQRLLHASSILDGSDSGRERMALAQPSAWSRRRVGEFEALVCAECGLTEWYVKRPQDLEQQKKLFQVIDGSQRGRTEPYR